MHFDSIHCQIKKTNDFLDFIPISTFQFQYKKLRRAVNEWLQVYLISKSFEQYEHTFLPNTINSVWSDKNKCLKLFGWKLTLLGQLMNELVAAILTISSCIFSNKAIGNVHIFFEYFWGICGIKFLVKKLLYGKNRLKIY